MKRISSSKQEFDFISWRQLMEAIHLLSIHFYLASALSLHSWQYTVSFQHVILSESPVQSGFFSVSFPFHHLYSMFFHAIVLWINCHSLCLYLNIQRIYRVLKIHLKILPLYWSLTFVFSSHWVIVYSFLTNLSLFYQAYPLSTSLPLSSI